ncbi:hypothetical protein BHE90_017271 [Fusarium euwallaceae]|uniref:Uncharacterized protein n=1 Tax=Fusarium euwallaceae TaxID=1147111 RepID=A0A430KXY1_9HYPO|nr:hypothetical protein BHE90_017271 [Fusarium euwallaceae]
MGVSSGSCAFPEEAWVRARLGAVKRAAIGQRLGSKRTSTAAAHCPSTATDCDFTATASAHPHPSIIAHCTFPSVDTPTTSSITTITTGQSITDSWESACSTDTSDASLSGYNAHCISSPVARAFGAFVPDQISMAVSAGLLVGHDTRTGQIMLTPLDWTAGYLLDA